MTDAGLPQQCHSFAPNADASNAGEMTKQLMNSIGGSQGCNLDSFYADAAGSMSAGPGGMLGHGSFSMSVGGLHKVGCQSINAVVGNFLNSVYTARCTIENDSTSETTDVEIDQNMFLSAVGPGSVISNNCPPGTSKWSESVTVNAKVVTSISKTSAQNIATTVQQGMQNTASQMQKSTSGFQATDSGVKQADEMQQKLMNASQDSSIYNTIVDNCTKFISKQSVTAQAVAGAKIINSLPCTWTPSAVMDLQLANIVSSAYSTSVTSSIGAFLKSDVAQKQVITSKGAPNVVGEMFMSGTIKYIVFGLVICILIAAIFKFKSRKNKTSGTGSEGSSSLNVSVPGMSLSQTKTVGGTPTPSGLGTPSTPAPSGLGRTPTPAPSGLGRVGSLGRAASFGGARK